jgi:hypothetical protein
LAARARQIGAGGPARRRLPARRFRMPVAGQYSSRLNGTDFYISKKFDVQGKTGQ